MAFLKWLLDVKNGPPLLSFGGFQKPGAIFFVVFGSLLERGTSEKNKNAIFVFDHKNYEHMTVQPFVMSIT